MFVLEQSRKPSLYVSGMNLKCSTSFFYGVSCTLPSDLKLDLYTDGKLTTDIHTNRHERNTSAPARIES